MTLTKVWLQLQLQLAASGVQSALCKQYILSTRGFQGHMRKSFSDPIMYVHVYLCLYLRPLRPSAPSKSSRSHLFSEGDEDNLFSGSSGAAVSSTPPTTTKAETKYVI